MAINLRQYLYETYSTNQYSYMKNTKKVFIQIDDQDDKDNITDFCNIFITIKKKNDFELELLGTMPITQEIADLAEIYHGKAELNSNQITFTLNPKQIEAVLDLASLIRKTASMGDRVGNSHWERISARTISSLHRFVRVIKEYISMKQSQLI